MLEVLCVLVLAMRPLVPLTRHLDLGIIQQKINNDKNKLKMQTHFYNGPKSLGMETPSVL